MRKGATFSGGDNRRHRYALWRIRDEDLPLVNFIGINPSPQLIATMTPPCGAVWTSPDGGASAGS